MTSTQMPSGLTRIDLGEPIKRIAADAQPVTIDTPQSQLDNPKPAPAPPALSCEVAECNWHNDYGLAKPP